MKWHCPCGGCGWAEHVTDLDQVFDHIQVIHPIHDYQPQRWPDGQVVIHDDAIDTTLHRENPTMGRHRAPETRCDACERHNTPTHIEKLDGYDVELCDDYRTCGANRPPDTYDYRLAATRTLYSR
jgi:hypothetical protein